MESANLGYEFHDYSVLVGLSASDAAASSATYQSISLVEILPDTFNKFIVDTYAFAESNKSDLEMQDDDAKGSAARIDDKAH